MEDLPENTESTGGSRFSAGKTGGFWYMPLQGIRAVARVAEQGADKYAPMDWREGQSFSTCFDCAMRHMIKAQHKGPRSINHDDGEETHLAHAAWNLLCMLSFIEDGRADEMDDISPYFGVTASKLREAESIARGMLDTDIVDVLRMMHEEGEIDPVHPPEIGVEA